MNREQPADADRTSDDASGLTTIAELKVVAVAETSAVCEVISSTRPVVAGDMAIAAAGGDREAGGEACPEQHTQLSRGSELHRRRSHGRRRTRCHTPATFARGESRPGTNRLRLQHDTQWRAIQFVLDHHRSGPARRHYAHQRHTLELERVLARRVDFDQQPKPTDAARPA